MIRSGTGILPVMLFFLGRAKLRLCLFLFLMAKKNKAEQQLRPTL
jgi:hypothetical protein